MYKNCEKCSKTLSLKNDNYMSIDIRERDDTGTFYLTIHLCEECSKQLKSLIWPIEGFMQNDIEPLLPAKHKSGDRVKVRKWEDVEKEYGLYDYISIDTPIWIFSDNMRKYSGSTVTISEVSMLGSYKIKEDNGVNIWSDAMFEN